MTTEQELLKEIWESNGKIPVQLIAKRLGISTDYVGYLCKELVRKGLIKKFEKDRYKITAKGRKSSVKPELITSAKKQLLRQRAAYKKTKKSTTKKVPGNIKRKIKKERKRALVSRDQAVPLFLKDEKISSTEQIPAGDSKIAKKEPNKLLKIFKGLFSAKKK